MGFQQKRHAGKARKKFRKVKPDLLVGSPMCTLYSAWQHLNKYKTMSAYRRRLRDARVHLEFVCELYRDQYRAGRLFLHEHPAGASSWDEQCILEVLGWKGVSTTLTDQCQFGQRSREGNPVLKPTKWMSNCEHILSSLSKCCGGRGGECSATGTPHQQCSGRTAREAAAWPTMGLQQKGHARKGQEEIQEGEARPPRRQSYVHIVLCLATPQQV